MPSISHLLPFPSVHCSASTFPLSGPVYTYTVILKNGDISLHLCPSFTGKQRIRLWKKCILKTPATVEILENFNCTLACKLRITEKNRVPGSQRHIICQNMHLCQKCDLFLHFHLALVTMDAFRVAVTFMLVQTLFIFLHLQIQLFY